MKRILKILFIVGCLSVIFVNVVSAYNTTYETFDIDSYAYGTPDYMVFTRPYQDRTESLTITPIQTLSVPFVYTEEVPYTSNTISQVFSPRGSTFYIPETLTVSGDQRNPHYQSMLDFGCRGLYDVAYDYFYDNYTVETKLAIGYDEFYLPMVNTGNGSVKYDLPSYPYYEIAIIQENNDNNYIRADYTMEYYVYDNAGNASVKDVTVKVLCYPYKKDFDNRINYYIIPIIPLGIPSTSHDGFLAYEPEFDSQGNYTISVTSFTNLVTQYLPGIHRAFDPSHPTSISKLTDFRMGIIFNPTVKADFRRGVFQAPQESDVTFTRYSYLGTNTTHSYTDSFYQENYDIRFGSSLAGRITDNTAWITWLIDSIDAFMDIRIGQNFTIGTISLVALSVTTVILILKFFAGG